MWHFIFLQDTTAEVQSLHFKAFEALWNHSCQKNRTYSLVRLVRPNTEELISQPFMANNDKIQNRIKVGEVFDWISTDRIAVWFWTSSGKTRPMAILSNQSHISEVDVFPQRPKNTIWNRRQFGTADNLALQCKVDNLAPWTISHHRQFCTVDNLAPDNLAPDNLAPQSKSGQFGTADNLAP